ncbi:hypothetical protein RIF29_12790 [Crotalaria pallida]|uniref:Protein BZR1 homolog n=1 Tax=Crotalaria pallida TaxID=3830 RepID=A0AAN9INK7_CROPI
MTTSDGATSMMMTPPPSSGRRKPSWRERENNRRRERRRRAIAAKIYSGLRAQGNYNLPKHCDNNEVLKALCAEAGWTVEPDGTTYRKGFKPPAGAGDVAAGTSTRNTPFSSQNPSPLSSSYPSPIHSYQVSPSSSSFPSPSHLDLNNAAASNLFPYMSNVFPPSLAPLRISNSAPVTPPTSSPTSRNPKPIPTWESIAKAASFNLNYNHNHNQNHPFFAASAPASPTHRHLYTPPCIPECDESDSSTVESGQWLNFQQAFAPSASSQLPHCPSLSFRMKPPLQQQQQQQQQQHALADNRGKMQAMTISDVDFGVQVKPWVGEKSHEVGYDDLELTLGSGKSPN